MEDTNYPFRKENDLEEGPMIMFHVISMLIFQGVSHLEGVPQPYLGDGLHHHGYEATNLI